MLGREAYLQAIQRHRMVVQRRYVQALADPAAAQKLGIPADRILINAAFEEALSEKDKIGLQMIDPERPRRLAYAVGALVRHFSPAQSEWATNTVQKVLFRLNNKPRFSDRLPRW